MVTTARLASHAQVFLCGKDLNQRPSSVTARAALTTIGHLGGQEKRLTLMPQRFIVWQSLAQAIVNNLR
jgi:hypothetical protein